MRSPLDIDAVRTLQHDRWPRIEVVDETASTNADLLAGAHERGDREVLVAERQTSGRGRLDRVWTSPPGAGLLFSMLVRPRVPVTAWGWLPLLTGVALTEAVHDATGISAALKWPNDLLVGGRKAAGILVQSAGDAVVIGIGVNVSTTVDELPVPTATSLALEGAPAPAREALLGAVLTRVDDRVRTWEDAEGDPARCGLATDYRRTCATLGQRVRVSMTEGPPLDGDAVDLDGSGRLVLDLGDRRVAVSSGDVEHVRPA